MTIATWYFIAYFAIPGQAYVGPMTAEKCTAVAAIIPEQGICRQAIAMQYCAIDGRPGVGTACPVFEPLPRVTVKEKP